jgi:preprotein translocase SecE subunit
MTNPNITKSKPRFGFIQETIAELRKVVWLKPREWAYLTALVLTISIAVGAILGALDYGFSQLLELFIGS